MNLSGVHINYFFICKRKLWLYSHKISMEQESELVKIGQNIHKSSLNKVKAKEVILDNICLDNIDSKGIIHEIKKSKKMKIAHKFQVLYYLMMLKEKGIQTFGVIHYLDDNSVDYVYLDDLSEKLLQEIIYEIEHLISSEEPPKESKKKFCRKCSYFTYCWC